MVDLTPEQLDIVASVNLEDGIYVVDAAAGSGKTTTAEEIVKKFVEQNPNSSVLCLVRGKDMRAKLEKDIGYLKNVDFSTVHSYAYNKYKKFKRINNVAESKKDLFECIGKLKAELRAIDPDSKYVSANDISNLFSSYYSNEKYKTVDSYVSYLIKDRKRIQSAALSVRASEKTLDCFHFIYNTMLQRGTYTHDMYLKEYALNCNDVSEYDLVVIDEAQDLNKYMCLLLDRIKCKKMYFVGDEKQRLFMWDNCVNAMGLYRNKANKSFTLSTSFRQNDDVIKTSNHLIGYLDPETMNNTFAVPGNPIKELPNNYTIATLFRTNAAMVLSAIQKLCKNKGKNIKIIFKGFDNTSVKSVLGNRLNYIMAFLGLDGFHKERTALEDKYKVWTNGNTPYILVDMIEEAKKLNTDLHTYLNTFGYMLEPELRQSHRLYMSMIKSPLGVSGCLQLLEDNLKRSEKDVHLIEEYSTVHKAKGFEWDYVVLGSDVWDFDSIGEFCIAYVGTTRAKIKCDYSTLNNTIMKYNECREYLDWHPSEKGWQGDLDEDLYIAKLRVHLSKHIINIDDVSDEHLDALSQMLNDGYIKSGYEFSEDSFEKLYAKYQQETDYSTLVIQASPNRRITLSSI